MCEDFFSIPRPLEENAGNPIARHIDRILDDIIDQKSDPEFFAELWFSYQIIREVDRIFLDHFWKKFLDPCIRLLLVRRLRRTSCDQCEIFPMILEKCNPLPRMRNQWSMDDVRAFELIPESITHVGIDICTRNSTENPFCNILEFLDIQEISCRVKKLKSWGKSRSKCLIDIDSDIGVVIK